MSSTEQYTVLGEKPVGALLLQYALPAIIAMMASSLYNIVDGIFIGQGVGADAITGLALTNPLMAISAAFGAMVGVGGATLMSVRLGQQDYESARKILGNVVLLNILCGLLFQVGVYLFLDPILRSFGASDATLPYAREFMHIILLGNVFTHLFYGLNAQLRSTNRPRLAMYSTFGSVFINAAFCALFIFGFGRCRCSAGKSIFFPTRKTPFTSRSTSSALTGASCANPSSSDCRSFWSIPVQP